MAGVRILPVLPLLALAALLPRGPAGAQTIHGELGRFEVWGLDFARDGAWRRRATAVRTRRLDLLRAGRIQELNRGRDGRLAQVAGAAVLQAEHLLTGTVFVPVLPFAYTNVPVPYARSAFQEVLFSPTPHADGRPYSLKTYYEELSGGLIAMEGTVFPPVRADSTAAYFEDGCNGIGVTNACPNARQPLARLLLQVLDSVSNGPGGDTLWSRFDNDGPDGIPNSGDDDGIVDFVTFLHPTVDGACGAPGIWSHRWTIGSLTGAGPYVTKTPRRDGNGNPIPGEFLRINDYTIQSQVGGTTACTGTAIMPIGTVAHETGHAFGLPDLYDTDPSSRTQGIGHWGLMGSGNYARPYSPASYETWSLAELGWVTLVELVQNAEIETGPRQFSDTVFVATTPVSTQRFLIENRQAVQSDSAQMGPDFAARKLPGLLVWLIDDVRIEQGRPFNRINTGSVQGVALMQADGRNDLRTPGSPNRGDTGDSYPGSTGNRLFGFASNPAARTHAGQFAGFAIDRIDQLVGGVMRFRFTRRQPSLITASTPAALIRVNGATLNRYQEVLPEGELVSLSVEPVQLGAGGSTRATFLSWSGLGTEPDQTYQSGPVPDTVTALFELEHRLTVMSQGGGSFDASVAGDLGAGVFLQAGTPVTLTALPPEGFDFVLWQGDTTTTRREVQMTMQRPYHLTAVFTPTRLIAFEDAALDLMGASRLTVEERAYLDSLGNRNGTYDVGDYLALLRRVGGTPGAATPGSSR